MKLNRQNRQDEAGALQALANQGIEIIHPSQEERAAWEKHAEQTLKTLDIGERFTAGLLQQMQTLIREYRQTSAR